MSIRPSIFESNIHLNTLLNATRWQYIRLTILVYARPGIFSHVVGTSEDLCRMLISGLAAVVAKSAPRFPIASVSRVKLVDEKSEERSEGRDAGCYDNDVDLIARENGK